MSSEITDQIRGALETQVEKYILDETLRSAVTHLLGRGKLYRPRLALATYESIKGETEPRLIPLVTPLELIHTFTLIHDDLPCMDDAALRRGVETVHLKYGEAIAVLAGDALSDMAFQVLADPGSGIGPEIALRLIAVLANATQAVVIGQVADIEGEGRQFSAEQVANLHRRKTGALLGACCQFGAILAGADRYLETTLEEVGIRLGQLFQSRDDLLSVVGDEAEVGKSLERDFVLDKSTMLSVLGAEGAQAYANSLTNELQMAIDQLNLAKPEPLLTLTREAHIRTK
jgi:geranylgeranyl diphosphate synthase type II